MARSNTGSTANWMNAATPPVTVTPLSISCWLYPANLTATMNLAVLTSVNGNDYFALIFDGSNSYALGDNRIVIETITGGVPALASTTTTIGSANGWNHAAAIWASATSRAVYLNGGGKGTNATSKVPGGIVTLDVAGFRVGGTTFGPINGRIAELAVWNAALTDSEIVALSNGVAPPQVRQNSLVRYWKIFGTGVELDSIRNFPLSINGTMAYAPHVPRIIMPKRQIIYMAESATVDSVRRASMVKAQSVNRASVF